MNQDKETQKKLDERTKIQDNNLKIQVTRTDKQLEGLYNYLGLDNNLIGGLGAGNKNDNINNLDPSAQLRFLQTEFKNVNNKLPMLLNMVTSLLILYNLIDNLIDERFTW